MLVLSRYESERIFIGDYIEIVIIEIRGSSVRLGIKAPKNIAVDREEVYLRKLAERNGSRP